MKEKTFKYAPTIWIPMVFVVMTFYMDDAYFNLLGSKAYIFLMMSFAYVICFLVAEREKPIVVQVPVANKPVEKKGKCNFLDLMVLAFVVIAIISTIGSPYPMDAFTGSYGWAVGCLYIVVLGIIYYIVSRNMKWQMWMYWVIVASATIVFLWAITDEFYMDIFGMHHGIEEEVAYNYLASIGNNNWFAGYWSMIVPFFVFGLRKGPLWQNVLIGAGLAVSVFAGINCRADSLFIGLGVILTLSLLRAIGEKEKGFYTGIAWVIIGLTIGLAKIIRDKVHMIEIDSVSLRFMNSQIWAVIVVVGILLLFMRDFKRKNMMRLPVLILGLILVGVGVYQQAKEFGPEWGTLRGENWMVAAEAFADANLLRKILGVGPDCYGHVYRLYTGSSWVRNAHNEYLQYLVTMGIFGLLAYMGIYVASFTELLKKSRKTEIIADVTKRMEDKTKLMTRVDTVPLPLVYICFTAIIAYAAQAVVNNPQALNGAILFTLLAILRGVDYTKGDEAV